MFALLEVLLDNARQKLAFATRVDASNFSNFLGSYAKITAGNGHEAYFPLNGEKIRLTEEKNHGCSVELNSTIVDKMLKEITDVLTGGRGDHTQVNFSIGRKNGALTFSLGPLPRPPQAWE